jgi:peptidoglycan/xylan/chitin deacetylase (PgdA/CDA1 family)
MYHRVNPYNDLPIPNIITPKSFEQQLQYLCRNYEIIELETLAHYLHTHQIPPSKAAVITFDDGYKDNYLYALPLLEKYGCPATIFLTVDSIGIKGLPIHELINWFFHNAPLKEIEIPGIGRFPLYSKTHRRIVATITFKKLRALSYKEKKSFLKKITTNANFEIPPSLLSEEVFLGWQDVKEMQGRKITFGSHTLTHPLLTSLSREDARREISYSKKRIEEEIGKEVTTFAYPYGEYNAEVRKIVKESGYICAVTTIPKGIGLGTNPYELGRFGAVENFDKFKLQLSRIIYDFKNLFKSF